MKAQELRIGNYIASSGNKENVETWLIGKVNSISSLSSLFEQIEVETDESFEWFFRDNYFGIPLTEEWLLKFGFESMGKLHPTFKKGLYIIEKGLIGHNYNLRIFINKDESLFITKLNDVHQLQNLYFAVTGEELELK
jgi:hypothetical protein